DTYTTGDAAGKFNTNELTECGDVNAATSTSRVTFSALTTAQKKNYATWYTYYRKRVYVLKRAVTELTQGSGARMGLGTLHNNNSVGTLIKDVDDISVPIDATAQANKAALIQNILKIAPSSATPLHNALDNAGKYYSGISQTGLFGAAPTHSTSETISALSPILKNSLGGSCQQNFTILMTDGYYNGSYSGTNVGDADSNKNTKFDGPPYADNTKTSTNVSTTGTLADIAMHYYEKDLQAGLQNLVPVTAGVDEAIHQHMVTYTVAFGLTGTLDPFGTKTATNADTDPKAAGFVWPVGKDDDPKALDDLWHAAYDGRGRFLSAKDAQGLINALNDAFADIAGLVGSASAVAVNTTSLQTDTRVYQSLFRSQEWSGKLRSLTIDPATGKIGSEVWEAGAQLNLQNYDTGRAIIAYNPNLVPRDAVPFRWAGIGAANQAALNDNPNTGAVDNDGQGAARLDYLRGDITNEGAGNNYRLRNGKLGDIVHTAPVHVGAPNDIYRDDLEPAAYSNFVTANEMRPPMVYVGANDGMLHGFDADTGVEKIAYVPGALMPYLGKLTSTNYTHRYYVDGQLRAIDAFLASAWHTVLTGTLGAGGQAVFALDVTDPGVLSEANAASILMWEFSDADDKDLGYTVGAAPVVRMANGKWAAVVGNGYNNTEADGNASTTGYAVLYLLFLEDGMDGVWTPGTDYIKLSTNSGTVAVPNGLAEPAPVDYQGDDIVDYVYAGDLKGNVWKFDVRDVNPSNWKVAYTAGPNPAPLFKAVSSSGADQPITTAPEVGDHPEGRTGVVVYAVTGKYLENGDNVATGQTTQSVYGLWDRFEVGGAFNAFDRGDLLQQQILQEVGVGYDSDGDGVNDTTVEFRVISKNPIKWYTGNTTPPPSPTEFLGWYMDLYNTQGGNTNNYGERGVTNPLLRGERLLFTTLLPSDDPCKFGGDGWLMELDVASGGQLAFAPFDLNDDGQFSQDDFIDLDGDGKGDVPPGGVKLGGQGSSPVVLSDGGGGSSGGGGAPSELKLISLSNGQVKPVKNNPGPGQEGRQSWRQMR
ncbi:MAG: pilus assembly protein, partial [Gammaproteobacteria bacterium]